MEVPLQLGALAVLATGAALLDVRTRRIPNWLTLGGLAAGLALAALPGGIGVGASLGGAAVALGIGIVMFATRMLGGGDVKLLVAVGAFLGPGRLLLALLLTAMAGGVLALAVAARKGRILPLLLDSRDLLVAWVTVGRHGAVRTLDTEGAVAIPYGVAIAIGGVAAWFA